MYMNNGTIKAVFNSWMGKRAIDYRREFNITPQMANGTAVNVVAMAFGNMRTTVRQELLTRPWNQ
jgi:phosphoenolpyruvate synthase/pyruvate phosphate dikinase